MAVECPVCEGLHNLDSLYCSGFCEDYATQKNRALLLEKEMSNLLTKLGSAPKPFFEMKSEKDRLEIIVGEKQKEIRGLRLAIRIIRNLVTVRGIVDWELIDKLLEVN